MKWLLLGIGVVFLYFLSILIPLALLIFLAVILLRAARFKPKAQPKLSEEEVTVDIDRAVDPIPAVPDTMLDGTPLTEDFYYYRSTLDPTMQQAYDLIRSHLQKGSAKFAMTVPWNGSRKQMRQ